MQKIVYARKTMIGCNITSIDAIIGQGAFVGKDAFPWEWHLCFPLLDLKCRE